MCIRQRSAESSVLAPSQLPFCGAPKSRGLGQTRAEVSSQAPAVWSQAHPITSLVFSLVIYAMGTMKVDEILGGKQ